MKRRSFLKLLGVTPVVVVSHDDLLRELGATKVEQVKEVKEYPTRTFSASS